MTKKPLLKGMLLAGFALASTYPLTAAAEAYSTGTTDATVYYRSAVVTPLYQNASPWSWLWYGSATLADAGCVPTSLTMAFNAYGNQLSVTTVADYLIGTGTFNTPTYQGTTQQGIALAAQHFGYKTTVLYSKEAIAEALKSGGVVIANVGSLHHGASQSFVEKGYTHAIVLQGYYHGYTTVFNPNVYKGVNTYSLDTIYNERSDDPTDSLLGSPFILIHP